MELTVVIPSYNTAETLGATLDAIAVQVDCEEFEVVVVDCSDDDRVERLAEGRNQVRVLRRQERFNPGEGRNIGAAAAKGKLLVFVDADVVLRADALAAVLAYHQLGHRMFGGALELNEAGANAASYLEHYFFNHESQVGRPSCLRNNLSSALMIIERDLFLAEEGFRDIPRMQDTEFSERVARKGVSLTFTPTVVGFQIQDAPLRQVLRKVYVNGRNIYFIRYGRVSLAKKALFFVLLPLMGSAKTVRIIARHLRYQDWRKRLITLAISPYLALAGVYWMLGFYDALMFKKGVSRER